MPNDTSHPILGPTGLDPAIAEALDYDEWAALGEQVHAVHRSHYWWVGDWLLLGEALFGEIAWDAVPWTYSLDWLKRIVMVCSAIPPDRRRPELHFSHHHAVAGLDPGDADRILAETVAGEWSVDRVREEARAVRRGNLTDADRAAAIRLGFLGYDPAAVVRRAESDVRLIELGQWVADVRSALDRDSAHDVSPRG